MLYGTKEIEMPKFQFRPYIRCELCEYAEKRDKDSENYIHCTKYPNMISHIDSTCKSSKLKENKIEVNK